MKHSNRFPLFTFHFSLFISVALCSCSVGGDSYDNSAERYVLSTMENLIPTVQTGNKFDDFTDNPFVSVAEQPVSTFSVDADGASYAFMRRSLADGYAIPESSVRIEEYLNYFTFDYASPTDGNTVAINGEAGPCPWNASHRLLRLGIKGRELKQGEVPQANFVFLVDVSGSMWGDDRLELLKKGLVELTKRLNPDDRIAIVTYSGEVRKLLPSTPVSEANTIVRAIKELSANGCTAGGQALKMAYEEAVANYREGANNRVIMGTDGDFNVGVTNTDSLVSLVEGYARQGIYMTCLGFGYGNFNDAMMEKISNAGNGTYNYIDCEEEMMKVFVNERERFVSVASDVKCQVTFNPDAVRSYRLIGYENRVMDNEDFADDTKDAAEIGAGQTITALYEIEPAEQSFALNCPPIATFDLRYKKALNEASIPLSTKVATVAASLSDNLRFAAGVAAYGLVLRNSPYKGDATVKMARGLVEASQKFDPNGYRKKFLNLISQASEQQQ